jgi:hypothetical protein
MSCFDLVCPTDGSLDTTRSGMYSMEFDFMCATGFWKSIRHVITVAITLIAAGKFTQSHKHGPKQHKASCFLAPNWTRGHAPNYRRCMPSTWTPRGLKHPERQTRLENISVLALHSQCFDLWRFARSIGNFLIPRGSSASYNKHVA